MIKTSRNLRIHEPSFIPQFIDQGNSSKVYRISDNLAAKVLYRRDKNDNPFLRNDSNAISLLLHEESIARECIKNKIAVPNPTGILKIPIEGRIYLAYLMRFIEGVPIWRYSKVSDLFEREIEKASEIFNIGDYKGNGI